MPSNYLSSKISVINSPVLLVLFGLVFCSCESFKDALVGDGAMECMNIADDADFFQQRYDIAVDKNLEAFERLKNNKKKPKPWFRLYRQLSVAYMNQGRYQQAIETLCAGLKEYQEGKIVADGVSPIPRISLEHCSLAELFTYQGQYDEAQKYFDIALKESDLITGGNKKDGFVVFNINPYIGKYYIFQEKYDLAIPLLQNVLDEERAAGLLSKDIAIAKNNLAMAYYYAGDEANAEKLLGSAARINATAFVGFPEDLAQSLTMLSRIAAHRGQTEVALKNCQAAREATHMHADLCHKAEESDVVKQIGWLQLGQGRLDEAQKAYHEAIELRRETGSATHPNCADAYKGLADVAAARNELSSATAQAERALAILDTSVVPTHPRTGQELLALSSIHELAGHPELAAPFNQRLAVLQQKPLGPWREDWQETAAFYAALLQKAGKQAPAARLAQLAEQLKQRPAPPASADGATTPPAATAAAAPAAETPAAPSPLHPGAASR